MWQDCLARLCVAACVQFICEAFACASAAAAANRVSERSGKDNDELAAGRQAGRQAAVRPGDADQVCVCWQRLGRTAQNPRLGRRYREKKRRSQRRAEFLFSSFFFFLLVVNKRSTLMRILAAD